MNSLHPAYLYSGPLHKTKSACKDFIRSILCTQASCMLCFTCKGIEQEQHYLVRWLAPDNYYTLAHLEEIFKAIQFTLNEGEHFFFVINQAELLSPACANSLLKSLEEPPAGYHFILLAERHEGVLPTITSRCLLQSFDSAVGVESYPLLPFFTSEHVQLTEFSKELERVKLADWNMLDFLDQLYYHWINIFKESINAGDQAKGALASQVLRLLDTARLYPPMPGSAKIFIRNLFLSYLVRHSSIRSKD